MKLTLEHTDRYEGSDIRKVSVEVGGDCLTIKQMWEDLIRPALLGMTFSESTVDGFLDGEVPMLDIETYLAGHDDSDEPDPVVDITVLHRTRDGREVTGLRHTGDDRWCIHGYVGGCKISWMANGRWSAFDTEHALDLIPTGEVAL